MVIAIIALLVGILLPSLSGARAAGRQTVCLSNQRQIGVALMGYADTYKGWLPREGTEGATPQTLRARVPWPCALRPWLDDRVSPNSEPNDAFANAPYYRCPSRPAGSPHPIHYVNNGFNFTAPGVVNPGGDANHLLRRGPVRLDRLIRPAKTLYLTELTDDARQTVWAIIQPYRTRDLGLAQFYDIWRADHVAENDPDERINTRRHGNGSEALFLDGHAEHTERRYLRTLANWDDGLYRQ